MDEARGVQPLLGHVLPGVRLVPRLHARVLCVGVALKHLPRRRFVVHCLFVRGALCNNMSERVQMLPKIVHALLARKKVEPPRRSATTTPAARVRMRACMRVVACACSCLHIALRRGAN